MRWNLNRSTNKEYMAHSLSSAENCIEKHDNALWFEVARGQVLVRGIRITPTFAQQCMPNAFISTKLYTKDDNYDYNCT